MKQTNKSTYLTDSITTTVHTEGEKTNLYWLHAITKNVKSKARWLQNCYSKPVSLPDHCCYITNSPETDHICILTLNHNAFHRSINHAKQTYNDKSNYTGSYMIIQFEIGANNLLLKAFRND